MSFIEFKKKYQKISVKEFPNNTLTSIPNPLVSCRISTYQHSKYIKKCLEGILMQKTNFDFEIIIGEDESEDGTREICTEYAKKFPNKIRLLLHSRKNNILINGKPSSRFQGNYTMFECRGKYIAICEGDDYWTDPLKLQKQVDFLEANPEYGLIHSNFKTYNQALKQYEKSFKINNSTNSCFDDLLIGNYSIGTLTTCFRKQLFIDYFNEIRPYEHNWLLGDLPLWLYLSNKSKFHFIDESTAVYRRLNESASNSQNIENKIKFEQSVYEVRMFFYENFSFNNTTIKKQIQFLLSYSNLKINVNHDGSFRHFISFFYESFKYAINFRNYLSIIKLVVSKFIYLSI